MFLIVNFEANKKQLRELLFILEEQITRLGYSAAMCG